MGLASERRGYPREQGQDLAGESGICRLIDRWLGDDVLRVCDLAEPVESKERGEHSKLYY
jgi:hypothetical protein